MNDVLGISGLESVFEDELRGKDGVETITRNSDGVIVDTKLTTVPEPGRHTVQLTIDSNFQRAVDKALADNIDMINRVYNTGTMKAAAGAAVVLDVKDGSVLAASNYPSFDQNLYAANYGEYSSDPSLPLFNRAHCRACTPPGSTFKPAVAVAALDSGLINQYSTVNCNGVYNYFRITTPLHPPWPQRQHRCGHGHQVELQHLLLRCGRRLTSDVYDAYAYKLGLGQRTGVEVSEAVGRLTTKNDNNYIGIAGYSGRHRSGQHGGLAHPAGYLCGNAGQQRRPLPHPLCQGHSGYQHRRGAQRDPAGGDGCHRGGNGNTFALVRQGHDTGAQHHQRQDFQLPHCHRLQDRHPQRSETSRIGKHYLNAMMIAYLPADDPEIAIGITVEYGGLRCPYR